jgi:hypothetical protein
LFDKNPPFSIQDGGTGNMRGYDPRYSDPLGRTDYITAGRHERVTGFVGYDTLDEEHSDDEERWIRLGRAANELL